MTVRTNPILHLVNTLQSERDVLIFLGAGSSTEGSQDDAPFPDFEMLVSRILQDEGVEVTDSRMDDFLDVMRRWERESTLSVRLASYLYGSPGISHLQLASMTMSLFPAINMAMYLTTNFDDLMFKALSAVSRNAPQRDPRTFSLKKSAVINEITQIFQAIPRHIQQGAPVVVKLFGDLASNSPIFDPREMPFDEFTEGKLINLLDRTTLFIGYGLHDAPILRLLIRSGSQRPVFVVAPVNPIDPRIAEISQRDFYWLPKTFSEFISELIEAVSAKNPIFEKTFANFLRDASNGLVINSRWALRECAQNASAPARARYLNRARGGEIGRDRAFIRAVVRPDTGPDFETFKGSEKRILGIVGESGSGKSTLLFQMYEDNCTRSDDQYIYYDSQSFQSAGSVSAKLALDLAVETAKLVPVLQQIASTLDRKGAQLFVFIDALNESTSVDPLNVRYEIESLTRELPANVRFVFSCRRVFWDAHMNPSNDLPLEDYSEGKPFLLSKFSAAEARSAYEHYRDIFQLKSEYLTLSGSLREHIRDPLMLRFISETYRASVLPQFAPAVLVFREVMNSLRLHYRQTPLIDFLDYLIDQRLDKFLQGSEANDIFFYRAVRTDSNLALLAQQQMVGRFHAEHPLTILEDENIIAPMESVATRFKFAYERFYEYLIGLRLHYRIFSSEGPRFLDFLTASLGQFRDAHYSFYQGLKSAFVMEYISTDDVERRREIALLARDHRQPFASFGMDVLREVAFESGKNAVSALAFVDDGQASTAALVLDLGFETEGVLPYAIQGLFEGDIGVRRRSVSCLIFHARNFGSLEKMNSMVVEVLKNGTFCNEALSRGLVYFFAAVFGAATDKSAAMHRMRCLLISAIAQWPTKVDLTSIAFALDDVVKTEGPLFFGANYGPDGIFYPWGDPPVSDVVRYNAAVCAILRDTSASTLKRNFDAVLFLSRIRHELTRDGGNARLFAYQIEYRIVQWAMVKAWMQDSAAVLELLDLIVEHGEAFNIDFALGVVEHALFRMPPTDRDFLIRCRAKMLAWTERFEERFAEFYLSLNEADPFTFNLVPLAVLARVEAHFFTAESGVVPCISSWLSDPSPARRKMALLAANWLSQEYPAKVLTTLEPSISGNGLVDWHDRVLAGFEWHSPRLLEEFFNKMHLPTRRRAEIRNLNAAKGTGEVQYRSESFFSWLFLGDQTGLDQLGGIYTMIYASPSSRDFFFRLLQLWFEGTRISVE
jgi:hypothetical protein